MALDNYKIFDGTDWINPCDCEAQILTPTGWTKLDPRNCPTAYWDGFDWCEIECFTPCADCPSGYIVNPETKTDCIRYVVPEYDGTMRVMSPGCDLKGTYGKYGLALFDEIDTSLGHHLYSPDPNGTVKTQTNAFVSQKPNILYSGSPVTLPATSLFRSNLWYYRLCGVGLMEYKYDVWNKKKAYALNTIVLYNDAGVWKKYKCVNAVTANIISPFNLNPKQATSKWLFVANVNTVYTEQGSNTDINEENSQFSFSVCVTLDKTKVYHLGFSADNECDVNIQLNETGPFQKVVNQDYSSGFEHWFVLPIVLPAGTHILQLNGYNGGNVGSIGLELYDFNKSNLASVNPVEKFKQLFVYQPGTTTISPSSHTTDTNLMLEPYIVFSTINMKFKEVPKVNDINPVTNKPYVPTCSDGSSVNYCNGAPSCLEVLECGAEAPAQTANEANFVFLADYIVLEYKFLKPQPGQPADTWPSETGGDIYDTQYTVNGVTKSVRNDIQGIDLDTHTRFYGYYGVDENNPAIDSHYYGYSARYGDNEFGVFPTKTRNGTFITIPSVSGTIPIAETDINSQFIMQHSGDNTGPRATDPTLGQEQVLINVKEFIKRFGNNGTNVGAGTGKIPTKLDKFFVEMRAWWHSSKNAPSRYPVSMTAKMYKSTAAKPITGITLNNYIYTVTGGEFLELTTPPVIVANNMNLVNLTNDLYHNGDGDEQLIPPGSKRVNVLEYDCLTGAGKFVNNNITLKVPVGNNGETSAQKPAGI